jgi:hypoxanthine phosphoribosyltransferase
VTDLALSTLIEEAKIQNRVEEIGAELTKKFKGEGVVAVCVLKGSFVFFSDLIREIDLDITCDFLAVSSYNGMQSSGEVKLNLDLNQSIEGKNVILVEDIVDTGLTMNYLKEQLQSRKPKSLTTVSLLFKPKALKIDCKLDYSGFEIGNEFVVGYGLDYQGYYRNLPYIAIVNSLN